MNNWFLLLLLGIGSLSFSAYYFVGVFNFFTLEVAHKIYVEQIIAPFIATIIGLYFIYKSFVTGDQLYIENHNGKKKKLSMKSIIKMGDSEYADFKTYLKRFL